MKYKIIVALVVLVCASAKSEQPRGSTDTTWCVVNHVGTFDAGSAVLDVHVEGNHCYVTMGWSGIRILDVSNPSAPAVIGTFDTDSIGFGHQLDISDDHLYVCGQGMRVLNVSDPANPDPRGYLSSTECYGIDVAGDYAYLALHDQGLAVVDVSDPEDPTVVANVPTDTLGPVHSVQVVGDFAYVAVSAVGILRTAYEDGLLILNVADPSSPVPVGFLPIHAAMNVFVSNSTAYVASAWPNHFMGVSYALAVADISDPDAPVLSGDCSTCGVRGSQLFVDDGYVYVAGPENEIFDVTDPSAPISIGTVGSEGNSVFVRNGLAYYACSDALEIFDVRIAPCCGFWSDGYTGNANCSDDGLLTLSDITRLIDYVFVSKEPLCCEGNGNTNGSEDLKITLADISRLIDRVFISKNATEPCL